MQIIAQIRTSECHHGVDASLLSLKWGIGLEKAKNTIQNTTQVKGNKIKEYRLKKTKYQISDPTTNEEIHDRPLITET